MQANDNEVKLLNKWKARLGLYDWRIELRTKMKPQDMMMENVAGCTDWSESIKTARIEIIDPEYYGERIVPFDFEKTLIHELLHLKFSFWCQGTDDIADRAMHQIIDDLARAFVDCNGETRPIYYALEDKQNENAR